MFAIRCLAKALNRRARHGFRKEDIRIEDRVNPMRTMGIDFGEARIGVAVSDEMGRIAMPFGVVAEKDKGEQIRRISTLIEEREVARVLVGIPYELDGAPGPMAQTAEKFAVKLESTTGMDVIRWDERFTSVAAQRALQDMNRKRGRRSKKKGDIDVVAACLMLQAYLDSPESR
jgi:putative Holliday junction resolvase